MISLSLRLNNFLPLLDHSQRSFRARGTPLGDWGLSLPRRYAGLTNVMRIRGAATTATAARRSIFSGQWKDNRCYASTKVSVLGESDHVRWRWGVR